MDTADMRGAFCISKEGVVMQTLTSERLMLRPFSEDDHEAVHSYASNRDNLIYMLWGPNTSEDTERFIRFAIDTSREEPCKNYQYAAVLKEDMKLIGGCGITLDDNAQAEIGWLLHRDYWKQGYGTEIGNCLLELAFDVLNLHRVIAHCDAENYGSYRVMENIGMRREGLFIEGRPANRLSGKEYGDEYSYAILKSEWKARQKSK